MVVIALLTGVSVQELVVLRWDEIDLDAGAIHLSGEAACHPLDEPLRSHYTQKIASASGWRRNRSSRSPWRPLFNRGNWIVSLLRSRRRRARPLSRSNPGHAPLYLILFPPSPGNSRRRRPAICRPYPAERPCRLHAAVLATGPPAVRADRTAPAGLAGPCRGMRLRERWRCLIVEAIAHLVRGRSSSDAVRVVSR